MNTMLKRIVSLVLCLVMVAGYAPVNAFADETGETVVTAAAEATNAPSVVELSDEATGVVEEEAAEAEENEEESLTADTGDPEEAVSEEANTSEEAPAEEETSDEVTSEEETSEEATEEAAAFVLEAAPVDVSLLDADAPVDAAIFFSDLHTNKSDYKENTVKGIMNGLKSSNLNFSSVTSCGDAFSVNEDNSRDNGPYTGYTSKLTGYIRSVFADIPVSYVWSDHDRCAVQEDGTTLLDKTSRLVYGAGTDGVYGTDDDGNYYVYSLSMGDLCSYDRYNAGFNTDNGNNRASKGFTATVQQAVENFQADAAKLKKDRPLFIASHQPLFDKRNDNAFAELWFDAINEVATGMDVAFFYGHNHKYDEGNDYYYAKGSTMPVTTTNGWNGYQTGSGYQYTAGDPKPVNKTLNFTHMCAGYLAPSSTGSISSTTREGTAVAVTIFEDSIQYVTYNADGKYTGNYKLDATVTRDHAKAEIEEPTGPSQPVTPEVNTVPDKNGTGITVTAPGVTGVSVEVKTPASVPAGYTAYASYDIDLEGYSQGAEATVTVPAPADFNADRPVVVLHDGEQIATTDIVDGKITFTTNHFSVYDVAQVADGELTWIEIPGAKKDIFRLTDKLTDGKKYVIVNRKTAGDGTAVNRQNDTKVDTAPVKVIADAADTYIEVPESDNTQWKYTKNMLQNVGKTELYLYASGNSAMGVTNRTNTEYIRWYFDSTNGLRARKSSTSQTYRKFSSYYIYEEDSLQTTSHYATLSGEQVQNYAVAANASLDTVLAKLVIYTSANGTAIDETIEVSSGMVTWDETFDGSTAGTYTGTVKYNNVNLGSVTVTVTTKRAKSVILDKYEGTVERDSAADAVTGAYLTVTWEDDTTEQVPVTLGMLSGNYNVKKNGTYSGLSFSYGGKNFENFTLKVVNKTGVDDYPLYPNPGSVDLKKSAAGDDFQNTGIARVELSASGLPYSKGVDVIVMLDLSSSMNKTITGSSTSRLTALKSALTTLETELKKSPNKDNIKVAIADFNGFYSKNSPVAYDNDYIEAQLTHAGNNKIFTGTKAIDAGAFVSAGTLNISGNNGINSQLTYASGTNYDYAFDTIYQLGTAIREENKKNGQEDRKLIVLFMSDGAANQFNFFRTSGGGGSEDPDYGWNFWLEGKMTDNDLKSTAQGGRLNRADHAYYYDKKDHDGDGIVNEHRMANAIKGDPSKTYEVIRKSASVAGNVTLASGSKNDLFLAPGLGATMYSIAFDITNDGPITDEAALHALQQIATSDEYYVDARSEAELKEAFDQFATAISNAAESARFVDQMGDSFNLQMNPTILTNDDESDGTRNTNTTIQITSHPVYTKEQVGTTVNGHRVTQNDIGKPYGNGTILETVSFTADQTGKISATTSVGGYKLPNGTTVTANSTNILVGDVIYGKNFFYNNNNAAVTVTLANGSSYSLPGETFYWNIGTIRETLYTISYTVYLEGSLDGDKNTTPAPGSYDTNNYATLYYTNHVGNEVNKSVPSPSLAWEGANVSYAFYLVNTEGKPVHADGTVASNFLQAHKLTQPVVYQSVKLNDDDGATLKAAAVAVLPEGYKLYANDATYKVVVGSGDGEGANESHWEITGDEKETTYVVGYGGANDYSNVQNVNDTSYDYTHTTVYFAVVWTIGAVQDTVVIDYGLPVDINVMANDMFGIAGTLTAVGLRSEKPAGHTDNLDRDKFDASVSGTYGTAELNNGKVRYTLRDMQIHGAEKLAYAVNYTGAANAGYYYGDLTVIPATTIYYEDEFVTLKTYTRPDQETEYTEANGWPVNSVAASGTQAEDRPGSINLSTIDANNIYGYDQAYDQMSTHSMGNSAMIHVDANQYGTAEFSFWGTGFDVISTTSNKTGTLVVQVYKENENEQELVQSHAVDTYYGYQYGLYKVTYEKIDGNWTLVEIADADKNAVAMEKEDITANAPNNVSKVTGHQYVWRPVNNDPNALYQVPVMQYADLPYAKYTVKISALYYSTYDATAEEGYDLYLDAIRIYDPAGAGEEVLSSKTDADGEVTNTTITDIYAQDGEAWPEYYELRDMIIEAETFNSLGANDQTAGIVFIDSNSQNSDVADYQNYGPNNELYLASGQAVAFHMALGNNNSKPGYVPVVRIGLKTVGGETAVAEMWNVIGNSATHYNAISDELKTATDMYYDITVLDNNTVVIKNSGKSGSILSITNVKLTYKPTTLVVSGNGEGDEGNGENQQPRMSFSVSRSTVNAALMSLAPVQEEIPEESVPETTVPETTVPETTVPEETKPAKPDNSELKAAVEEAKKLKSKGYTQASFKNLKTAIKAAEKVLKDKKATQAQIDKALDDLNAAVDGLETVAVKPIKPKPGGSNGKIKNNFKAMDSIADVFRNLLKGNKK